ncbi:MAG TPA: imidazole glycerol phosphate synthase subunit HisH [Solirubrobacterales bacterium]|nr:imidazole glycerol phosphate synthase subunit HisH [Solirubrobacterales bacterium]
MKRAAARIAILDYGMGNLRSVEKALDRVDAAPLITSDAGDASGCDGLILPGVGAFPRAIERIRAAGLDGLIAERRDTGTPILGICLGLQLLFESSDELGGAEGLGLLPGPVEALRAPGLKVPHIGWEPMRWEKPSPLADGIPHGTPFYFVHSHAPRPQPADTLGTAAYGERFAAAVENGNVFGVQFHPEKSSAAGLRLLANFAEVCLQRRSRTRERSPAVDPASGSRAERERGSGVI